MDDFSDLLWTDPSANKSKAANNTLGNGLANKSPASGLAAPGARPYDAFAALASTASGSRANYSRTNSNASGLSGSLTPASRPSASPSPANASGDAFGSLFGNTSSASSSNLSIAQRQAKLAQSQQHDITKKQNQHALNDQGGAFWDRFESGSVGAASPPTYAGSARSRTTSSGVNSPAVASLLSPSSILQPTSRPSSAATSSHNLNVSSTLSSDPWGDFDALSPQTTVKSPTPSRPPKPAVDDLFDFGEFEQPAQATSTQKQQSNTGIHVSRPSSPGDFDFGDREDGAGLLGGDNSDNDEFDILGDLARPVDSLPSRTSSAAATRTASSTLAPNGDGARRGARTPISRAVSPPPHIIGQIVEMGFSPQQARVALAATDSGVDVQAALDSLLNAVSGEDGGGSQAAHSQRRGGDDRHLTEEEAWEQREAQRLAARRRRNGGTSPAPPATSSRGPPPEQRHPTDGAEQEGGNAPAPLDKVLSQASEIGLNVFKTANAFWSSGKAQLQKAYEERQRALAAAAAANGGSPGPSSGTPAPRDGRPRWAQSAEADFHEDESRTPTATGGFRDEDDDEGPEEAVPTLPKRPTQDRGAPRAAPANEVNLFSDDSPTGYISPHRRRPGREQHVPAAPPPTTAPPSSRSARPPPPSQSSKPPTRARPPPSQAPPEPKRKRVLVPASPSALSASKAHRTRGTEMYKLGRYGEAEAAYTQALAVVPQGHIVRVPLCNNRAAARLKVGDGNGVVEDCTVVLKIIDGEDGRYHPSREEALPPLDDGEVINLAEGYVKALQRRAQAYESSEKWANAQKDWERLMSADWPAGMRVRQEAVRGLGQCRKMLQAGDPSSSAAPTISRPTPKPKPRPKPRPVDQLAGLNDVASSEGVSKLRAAADTQEAEDAERVRIKDGVDAKLLAWKGGKEANLRALIASLDSVLWPELGWVKVGMHELVTPSQVKVRYMRAIGRVHPDKLSAMQTTLEQRMIANGVFGALNEAWNAFKP